MRRNTFLLMLVTVAMTITGCGDPLVILGESPGIVRNVVGVGDSAGNHIDAVATKSRLLGLSAVAFNDADNILFVADRGSNRTSNGLGSQVARLFSVTSAGALTMILDGGGCTPAGLCMAEATNMIVAPGNTLIIADAVGNRIFQFNVATKTLSVLAGTGAAVAAPEGSVAATSSIFQPAGLARDVDGTLYITERGSGRVIAIGTDGIIHVIGGGGTAQITATAASATTARMASPSGLALGSGNLYIVDRELNSVFELNLASASIKRILGDGLPDFSGDGGPALAGRVRSPHDAVLSADGITLYIADTGNNRVRSINLTTGVLNTYAGSGLTPYNGDYVAAGSVNLNTPVDLAASTLGFLFIVDQAHFVVRRATNTF